VRRKAECWETPGKVFFVWRNEIIHENGCDLLAEGFDGKKREKAMKSDNWTLKDDRFMKD
jgi:hypothetical protein